MRYLDTSVLITVVASENSTGRIQAWLEQNDEPLCISDWSIAEFASGIANKRRIGDFDDEEHQNAQRWLAWFSEEAATMLPVSRASFRRAAQLTRDATRPLRAPDALHLAVAEANGATLLTLDVVQAESGSDAGIATGLL